MDRRDAYRKKLEAEIAKLRSLAEERLADARAEHPEQMKQLEARIEVAKAKLAELADAGGGRWDEIKRRLDAARTRLDEKRRTGGS